MAGKSTTFQPNRAGLSTPQVQDNVHHVADRVHEFQAQADDNIARRGGRAKKSVVQVHGAMTSRQVALKGMGHANAIWRQTRIPQAHSAKNRAAKCSSRPRP